MSRFRRFVTKPFAVVSAIAIIGLAVVHADDDQDAKLLELKDSLDSVDKRTSDELYAPPAATDVRTAVLNWVAGRSVGNEAVLERVGKMWALSDDSPAAAELFDRVIETFAIVDGVSAQFMKECRLIDAPLVPPTAEAVTQNDDDTFYTANMKLFYARYLCRRAMYDEALAVFDEIDVHAVIDPASALFYKAVCEHSLLKKDAGLATIESLLKNTEDVPVRYSTVATLMQYDLESLKEKSLDEVARMMADVERRLNLGRGGKKVQTVEDEIVARLDELIKKIEDQQKNSSSSSASGSGSGRSNQPNGAADDSRVKGSTAPGEVDEKDIGSKDGWGAMPAKQEAKAKNIINRNFPSHYRQAIERYFKKLANRRATSGK